MTTKSSGADNLRLPWRVHLVDNTTVIEADGRDVVSVHGDYETEWEAMEERADFIAQACNSHHAMKEALEACAESLAAARDKLGMSGEGDHKDRKADASDTIGSLSALLLARAALSLSKVI